MSTNKRDGLLSFLRNLKEDRAAMSNLRCVLIKTKRYRAWPYLSRFGGIGDELDNLVVQTIVGLYATHPNEKIENNYDFGNACNSLMEDKELKDLTKKPTEVGPVARRFQHLLAAETGKEINARVIRFVLRMKAKDIPVNYADLYDGLLYWGEKSRNRWAGSFWSVLELEEAAL